MGNAFILNHGPVRLIVGPADQCSDEVFIRVEKDTGYDAPPSGQGILVRNADRVRLLNYLAEFQQQHSADEIAGEQVVLAALLTVPGMAEALATQVTMHSFADPIHGAIYSAFAMRHLAQEPCDFAAIADELGEKLNEVGGAPYLARLAAKPVDPVDAMIWARRIRQAAQARQDERPPVRRWPGGRDLDTDIPF